MKKTFLSLTFLFVTALGISLTGCSNNNSAQSVEPTTSADNSIFTGNSSELSSVSASSSTGNAVSSSSSRRSSSSEEGYRINYSSYTLTMGDELQLSITNNGRQVSGVTWSTSDNQLTRVDTNGKVKACFFTDTNETVIITGKINNRNSLTCKLKINPRSDSIFARCYQRSESVNQDDDGHVIYMFVHAGLEANGTLLVNKTFEYDSYTNICHIKVSKSYTESGVTAYYIGRNDFYWGDYRNGLFYGQYSEVYNGVEKGALFSFNHIGFSYSSHTIMLQDSTTYSISESDWSSITDESTVALGVFYRVQECSEYAEEKFSQYNFGIHLF